MRHRTNMVDMKLLRSIIKIRIDIQEIIPNTTFEMNQEETKRIGQSLTRSSNIQTLRLKNKATSTPRLNTTQKGTPNIKRMEVYTQGKEENHQYPTNLSIQMKRVKKMRAILKIAPSTKYPEGKLPIVIITEWSSFTYENFISAILYLSLLKQFFHRIMIEYTLTEEDILYCRKAIEDYDDDGNGQIGIFDL